MRVSTETATKGLKTNPFFAYRDPKTGVWITCLPRQTIDRPLNSPTGKSSDCNSPTCKGERRCYNDAPLRDQAHCIPN